MNPNDRRVLVALLDIRRRAGISDGEPTNVMLPQTVEQVMAADALRHGERSAITYNRARSALNGLGRAHVRTRLVSWVRQGETGRAYRLTTYGAEIAAGFSEADRTPKAAA